MKYSKYIYLAIISVVFLVFSVNIDVGSYRDKTTLTFSLVGLIAVSLIIVLSFRNYFLVKKFDFLYFAISYLIIMLILFVGILNGFSYKSFNYYYFNFVKISEILIFLFGIFILRERVNIEGLKKAFIILSVITIGYFAALIYFDIIFINILLLNIGVLVLYGKIEQPFARKYFTEVIILRIVAEIFELLADGVGTGSMFIGGYIFYAASYIRMAMYFNLSLNKAYIGNFYLKEKKIRNLVNTSNDGIITLSGYFVKKINNKALEIFEFKEVSKIKGKNIFSIFNNIKKEDIDKIIKNYPHEEVIEFKKYNDKSKKFKVVGFKHGRSAEDIVLIFRNPNYSNDFFYKINDSVDFMICLYDLYEKKYIYISQAVHDMLGYKPEEFYANNQMGQSIVFEKDIDKYIEFFKIEAKSGEIEMRYKHKNGRLVWMHEKQTRVKVDDKEYLYIISSDITRKKIDLIKLESKNDALEDLNSKKDMSMSMIAHEIRSPITAIIGFLENILMNNQELDKKTKEMLGKTYGNSMRLKELVNNILDFNKLNAEKFKPYFEVVDIGSVLKEIVLNNDILIKMKNIEVTENIGKGIYAYVDEQMFYQVINNLISNAIKYNKENGKILIDAYSEKEEIIVRISDTGIGIKENEKANVFEEYKRGTGVREKGTGIGLTLVKKLVEINKGTIWFESEIGKGSKFYVKFIKKENTVKAKEIF